MKVLDGYTLENLLARRVDLARLFEPSEA